MKKLPVINVIKDFDGVFQDRVLKAIQLNIDKGIEMVSEISIDSGPYRPDCLHYDRSVEDKVTLDFYSAARVFGFQHTIENIASCIVKDMKYA